MSDQTGPALSDSRKPWAVLTFEGTNRHYGGATYFWTKWGARRYARAATHVYRKVVRNA